MYMCANVLFICTTLQNLVDLAGSEKVVKTKSEGIRFKEGTAINLSLHFLANVISKLCSNEGARYIGLSEAGTDLMCV